MAKKEAMKLTLTIRGVKRLLGDLAANNVTYPLFQRGTSGIGKSEAVRQVAREHDGELVDERAIHYEPPDFKGYLHYDQAAKAAAFAPSHLEISLKRALERVQERRARTKSTAPAIVVCHLDEWNLAKPTVQNAGYELFLDRKINGWHLPDSVLLVASGNRTEDRAYTYTMPVPLVNRFLFVDVDYAIDEWTADYAVPTKMHPFAIAFLHFRKELFHKLPEADQETQFPTPRGWDRVSRLLSFLDPADPRLSQYACGLVGDGAALEFAKYCQIKDEVDRLLAAVGAEDWKKIPQEPSILYALNQFLIADFRDNPKANADKILKYALHLPVGVVDIAAALCKSMVNVNKAAVAASRQFPAFAEKWGQYYLGE
jgi:hypothetical protein